MKASRAVRFVLSVGGALLAGAAAASTPALVVDADTGKVLYAERATTPWYPASITKLMTVYVALAAVREGRVSLDTLLGVSSAAVVMPPSKMGFKPGTELTLDNALKMVMVKSANDVSVTIAEGIAGSVDAFADMMNEAARRLGMRESRFVNPHGLPDERQQTSARDMAILARALLRDFPEYHGYFQIGAIKLGRRVMSNHNGLLGRYPGADGMKTGFICASGFNVVASATRNGRRLITVVMGAPTSTERTIKAAQLLDQGFASSGWGAPSVQDLPSAAWLPPPDLRTVVCDRRKGMPAEDDSEAEEEEGEAEASPTEASVLNFLEPAVASTSVTAGLTKKGRPKLAPRVRSEPVLVWTGATPSTNVADYDEPPRRSTRNAKLKRKSLSRTAKRHAPRPGQAFAASDPDEAPRKALARPKKTAKAATSARKPNKTAAAPGGPKKTAAVSSTPKKTAAAERAAAPKKTTAGTKSATKPAQKKPQAAKQKQAAARIAPD